VQQHGAVAVRRGQRVTAKARLHNGLITRRVGDKCAGDAAFRRNCLTTCLLSSWVEDSYDESAAAVLLYDYFELVSPSQTLIFPHLAFLRLFTTLIIHNSLALSPTA